MVLAEREGRLVREHARGSAVKMMHGKQRKPRRCTMCRFDECAYSVMHSLLAAHHRVHGGGRHACLGGDIVDPGSKVAARRKKSSRGIEDCLPVSWAYSASSLYPRISP